MKSLSFNWILNKVLCVDTCYLGIAYFRGKRSFFSHSYILLLLFPSGSFWKRNIWKLITIWKSVSPWCWHWFCGMCVSHNQTSSMTRTASDNAVKSSHSHCVWDTPSELNEKGSVYQFISRVCLGMWRFPKVWKKERRYENLIRTTYQRQEPRTRKWKMKPGTKELEDIHLEVGKPEVQRSERWGRK